jgi:hypothetical protein
MPFPRRLAEAQRAALRTRLDNTAAELEATIIDVRQTEPHLLALYGTEYRGILAMLTDSLDALRLARSVLEPGSRRVDG